MANNLLQDPLVIDTNATDIVCHRIVGIMFDAGAAATASIVDGSTSHPLWSATGGGYYPVNVYIASGLIDVTRSAGTVYIYLGSGPR